jgi:toxin ParE1/3/4
VKKIVVHPEARSEMRSAIRWYEAQRQGLGGEFNDAVEAVLKLIETNPRRGWSYGKRGYRVLPTARFPYLVYYIERDDAVRVMAIAHERRQPDYWQHRT